MLSSALVEQKEVELGSISIPTNKLIHDYLLYVRQTLNYSDQTIKYYSHVLEVFNQWLDKDITDLTLLDVDEFFLTRNLKQSSKNTEKSILRSFLRYVDRYRDIRLRFDYTMIRNGKQEETKIKYFQAEEVNNILKRIDNDQDKLIVYTLFATGMRIGELVTFTVDDIKSGEITIKGKGGKRRVIPIRTDLHEALQAHIQSHNLRVGAVFRHQVGKKSLSSDAYTVSGLRKRLQRICGDMGISMNPHMFRHSIATSLLQNGMDIRSVQTFLGHEHIQTTMRYTHVTNQHLRDSYLSSFPHNVSNISIDT
jgi:integrase/recombinase XerC